MFMKSFAVAMSLSILAAVPALSDVPMVDVECSYPAGYHGKIAAQVNERGDGLASFQFVDSKGGKISYSIDDLHKGVVLVRALGKDILKIQSKDFSAQNGGQMTLTFLRNFLGSDRRSVHFNFTRVGGATDWALRTDDQQGSDPFDGISVYVYKKLGVPSGVQSIELKSAGQTIREYNPFDLPEASVPELFFL